MSSTNGNSSKNQDNQQNVEQNHSRQASERPNHVRNLTAIISLKSLLRNVLPSDEIPNNEGNLANRNLQNSSKILKIIEDYSPGPSNPIVAENVEAEQATAEIVEDDLIQDNSEGNHLDEHHSCIEEENPILDCAKELITSTHFHENTTEEKEIISNTNDPPKQDSNTTVILAECNTSCISNENRRVLSQIEIYNCNNSHNVHTPLQEEERQTASSSPRPLHETNTQIPVVVNVHYVQAKQLFEQESEVEITITPPPVPPCVIHGPPPLAGAPPSYSAVMRLGSFTDILPPPVTRRREVPMQPSPPFIAPIPPPTYAEAEGFYMETGVASVDQMIWGPEPTLIICPRCAAVVVTSTQSRRSNLSHFSALAMCLCGCWPCCLLPYCMDSCKNTYHHCPSCQYFLGMYRPW